MKKRIVSFCMTAALFASCLGFSGAMVPAYGLDKTPVSSISSGLGMNVVLKDDGTVWIWGHNEFSDFGLKSYFTPTQVEGLTDVVAVSVGWDNAIALKNDGTVWSWGTDIKYGGGTIAPVEVEGLTNIISVSTGLAGSMALKNDGTVWTWDTWISGDGTKETRTTPVMVPGLKDVTCISMGMNSAYVVKKDGTVWGWGDNYYGKLGNGSTMNQYSPVQVKGLSGIVSVSAGDTHTLALKKDGTVWGWGYNALGELAKDVGDYYNMPAQIHGVEGAVAVSAGNSYSAALLADGTIKAWGDNSYGQLGHESSAEADGYTIFPSTIKTMGEVVSVAAGAQHVLALKKDGSVWIWGDYKGEYEENAAPTQVSINLGEQAFGIPSGLTLSYQAVPTKAKVLVNGKEVSFEAYNIGGNNYFKLRDLAMSLRETEKQFEVTWNGTKNAIDLLVNKAYTPIGGELEQTKIDAAQTAILSSSKVYIDGKSAGLTAYNIAGSNFFKLRDLGDRMGFRVEWVESQNAIVVDTI